MALATPLKKMLIGRSFSTEKSRIKLFGKMDWTLEPSAGMSELIQLPAVEYEKRRMGKGEEFLFRIGHENGIIIIDEIIKISGSKSIESSRKILTGLLEFIGLGQFEIMSSEVKSDGHHRIVIKMFNNPIVEHSKRHYKDESMVCSFFMGIYSAFFESLFLARKVRFKEKKCICKDKSFKYCEWESRW